MKMFSRFLSFAVVGTLLLAVPVVAQQTGQREEKRAVATVGADGVQRVEILGGGYFYNPNYVVVKVNVPVELTLKREPGFTPHDFVIKAPEAGIEVSAAMETKPTVVRFTPTKPGKYPFYCSKKMVFMSSHRDKGMEGMLEVQ
jgi:plastocyanin domain-containing protein